MQCPLDGETLLMTSREGVEIDYCPRCRGVWLDRGELDKIIERASSGSAGFAPAANRYQEKVDSRGHDSGKRRDKRDDDERKSRKYRSKDFYRKRKTKSFLKEIFDFD